LGTVQRHESREYHYRHSQANNDAPGPSSVYAVMAVLSCRCHFCSNLQV
jgi:hypothetical protein